MAKLKFLIVEDEALIREGLCSLLEGEQFTKEILEASSKKEFAEAMQKHPDLILLDFKLEGCNGLELLQIARKSKASIKVIAVTGLDGTELLLNLLRAGVNGIVYKLDGYKEIKKTIERVIEGGSYFSEKVLKIIQANANRWDVVPPVTLSFSDRELLSAVAKGFTTKEIAVQLKMTEATTETYRQRLMKKVSVSNTAALIAFGFRNGIL